MYAVYLWVDTKINKIEGNQLILNNLKNMAYLEKYKMKVGNQFKVKVANIYLD